MQNNDKNLNAGVLVGLIIMLLGMPSHGADAPIIQPGLPGELGVLISSKDASEIADSSHTAADIQFMTLMIPHHDQALTMSKMAPDRTNNKEVLEIAGRIEKSQADEIAFMRQWLSERGASLTSTETHEHHEASHSGHNKMHGMASENQLSELKNSEATKFDQMFLKLMIAHHDGAIKMVKDLRDQPGSAYDSSLNEFASDVSNDQTVEIERMNQMLVGLSDDPRAGLAGGLFDAEYASKI